MKNKYARRSKISEAKFRELVKYFALDLTATQSSELSGLNINTVDRFYQAFRQRLCDVAVESSPIPETVDVEVDESYFGPRRVKGKRGRGAGSKIIVFGLFKRNGKVYTEIVSDCRAATLSSIIRGKVSLESVIYSDCWRGYDGLVDLGFEKHFRVKHSDNEFSKGNGNHINGIESFWGYAKHRLTKFKGIRKDLFKIYLKETEFRFNHRDQNLYAVLLKIFRDDPLF